jgi:peptide/nickel transport system permease protein
MTRAAIAVRPRRPGTGRRLLTWLRHDLRAVLCLLYLGLLAVLAVLAPWVAPHSPTEQNAADTLLAPSAQYWLGTDDLGRDVLSRLIFGAPASLYASFLAVSIATAIGVPFGLLAGLLGGWVDRVISRLIDTLLSFPGIVLAIGVTGALGIGLTHGMIAVGLVFSPMLARLARAQALVVKNELYVDAARSFGATSGRILLRHILPNAVQPLIVQITILLAGALLAEASLSFLGLGAQPPQASWGAMLARAYIYIDLTPEQMYAPGIAILLTALAFNGLGESLREALDPTMRSR